MGVSYWDAWRLWYSGHLDPHAHLWILSIFWWGRAGRITEFVAGLFVVGEIVGYRNIHAFATRLLPTWRDEIKSRPRRWSKKMFKVLGGKFEESWWYIGFFWVVVGVGGYLGSQLWGAWWTVMLSLLVSAFAALVILWVGGMLVLGIAFGFAFGIYGLFALLARLLGVAALERWVTGVSVLLLIAGFQFDLLSS
jgi:hypothetical protein